MRRYHDGRGEMVGGGIAIPVAALSASYPPADWTGWIAYCDDGLVRWSNGFDWVSAASVAEEIIVGGVVPRFFSPGFELTVGPGGNYATLNAAVSDLLLYTNNNPTATPPARILIKSGFVAAEQVFLSGINASWIQIDAEDDWVDVDVTGFAELDETGYPFMAFRSGSAPVINCGFRQVGTPPGPTTGLDLRGTACVSLFSPATKPRGFRQFGIGTAIGANSSFRSVDWQSIEAATDGLLCQGGSYVNLLGEARIFGAARSVVAATWARLILSAQANVRREDDVARSSDLVVTLGGRILAPAGVSLQSLCQSPNIEFDSGLINVPGRPGQFGLAFAIADGAVATLVPPRSAGFVALSCFAGNDALPARSGIVGYAATATPSASVLTFGGYAANLAATTGTLSGATGSAGNVTVSALSNGSVQIENRSGGSRTFTLSWM
ncbi:MAG: hypothetical protein ACK4OP_00170 [Gemmobacter sp.]